MNNMGLRYNATCLTSTWVSTYSWLGSTLHSVPSSCTLCQKVLIASISEKKYRFGVSSKVVSKFDFCSWDTFVTWTLLYLVC